MGGVYEITILEEIKNSIKLIEQGGIMSPYLEIHVTLERFQNDFLRLITEEFVKDEDINKVYRKYDDELMTIVKKAEIEALEHALEFMGQFPDFNLANMYEYIRDKERENIENGI